MSDREFDLWSSMSPQDRRHSLKVVNRFIVRRPNCTNHEIVGVAMHDVGKISSDLGVMGRVLATMVGPVGSRFKTYHEHELEGARLLHQIGTDQRAIGILESTAPKDVLRDFRWADDY